MSERQMYEDVLDVALRQTLKEHGFTRKSRRDYVLERPGRIWTFEVEMERRMGDGFLADATVFVPELDAILEHHVPGFYGQHAPSHGTSTVKATITVLMEIEAGHDFYTRRRGPNSQLWSEAYQRAQEDPIMRYRYRGYWTLPQFSERLEKSDPQDKPDWEEGARELGLFLDAQWRAYVWDWYHKCDDPMFVVHWIETQRCTNIFSDCSLAVLCHMAGNPDRTRFYLQRRVDEGRTTYEELYKEIHRHYRGNWLQRLWSTIGWSEEQVVDLAQGRLQHLQRAAEAARKLAAGFDIQLD